MRTLPILLLASALLAGCSEPESPAPAPYQKQALDKARAAEQQLLDAQQREMSQLREQQ